MINRLCRLVWLGMFSGLATVIAAQPPSSSEPGPRPATVEDSVRLRTFADEQPAAVSPDGGRVAYVLVEPNLKKNYNETVLYVRTLPETTEQDLPREPGKVVLRTRGIRQMQWLVDGQHLLVLHRPDGGQGNVVRVDRESGAFSSVTPNKLDVEAFAATPDGRRLALLANMPDQEQEDRFAASPRGVVITEEDFLLDVDARGTAKNKATLTAVVVAEAGGGTLTVFAGKRSLGLMRPSISPNGRYVDVPGLGDALPYLRPGRRTRLSASGRREASWFRRTNWCWPSCRPRFRISRRPAEANWYFEWGIDAGCIATICGVCRAVVERRQRPLPCLRTESGGRRQHSR